MPKVYLSPSNQTENRYAYGNTNEAEQCGRIAEACRAALERSGVTVKLGHMPSMQEKVRASDAFGAELHVPIHTNAFNGSVMGTRMFCYNGAGKGMAACKAIFARVAPLSPGTSENIQVNQKLYEVRVPKAPTAYLECEFHDTVEGARWIVENAAAIGEAIARGICDYLNVTFVEPAPPKPAEPEQPAEQKLYRVQVGAFANRDNAEKMVQRLKAAGFDAFIRQDA